MTEHNWTDLNQSTQLRQVLIGHARSLASRHVDLIRPDWLPTERTRSHSSRTRDSGSRSVDVAVG